MRALTSSGVSHQGRDGQSLGENVPFSIAPAALVRGDAWGLRDGPSASWVTWLGPLNWVSPTVKPKNMSGQFRKQGNTIPVLKCLKLCLSPSSVHEDPSFPFFNIYDSSVFLFFAMKM